MWKILVVDDQANMCWILEKVLTQAGYTVSTVCNAGEAIEIASAAGVIDAAIIDYRLADANGFMILDALKVMYPDISAILITSYGSSDLKKTALKHGFKAFLDKPFRNAELLAMLANIMDA